eukprot:Em0012g697a
MTVHGNLRVFDRDLEDWASYCERVEQYFIANGISNADRKRAILLSVCGPATFKLIRSLIAPDKPSDKSFEQIVKAVSDHLCPTPSSILQRFYFNSCVQKESESIAQFVAELRRLAVHCEFEGTLEIMLRDRLVCGVCDPQLQKRLLAERQLTFSKALELAQAFESAESSSRDIQAVRSPSVLLPVHSVDKKGLSVPDSVSCFRCGGKHYATTCKLKSVTCNNCGKTGHIAKVCRSNPTGAKSSAARQKGKAARGHSSEKEDSPPREGSKVHSLYNFSSSSNKLFRVTLQVNGVNLPMEIDTGAAVSILSEATYKSPSERDHICNLEKVLSCLEESGLKLKLSKCSFLLSSVEYLGHRISAAGIQPTEDKKKAILQAPAPKNVTELKSWLGLLNYYSKFLPNLSATLAPLYDLLKSQRSWSWESSQQVVFSKAKELLISASVLVHYEPDRELVLACDASEYGVGAVLSHHFEEGFDRPIAFASRTLAPAERKYSQLDKEALAIVFGVDKFHQYLYAVGLTLSAFDYTISFRAGKLQGNADALSRLPLQHSPEEVPTPGDMILLLEALDLSEAPISAAAINKLTGKDPVLSRVRSVVQHGTWDSLCSDSVFQPYKLRRLELSVQDGCVLWGSRVVVPQVAREAVIKILHEAHPGISRMKSLARGIVWWPGIDKDLEEKVAACEACQVNHKSPTPVLLHPWEFPSRPWSRVHVDFAGPFLGKQFIILVDASTKWLEVGIVASPSSQQAVKFLHSVFSTHGLPDILVSDNGSAFSSSEFEEFVKRNGFRHIRVAPYHPASNGAAERAVQTLKEYLSKTRGDLETRLSRFLFQYRLTPHTSTGSSPAELLFGRRPKSHLDFIHPDLSAKVTLQQERQHLASESGASIRAFLSGDKVYVRNFSPSTSSSVKWLPDVVTSQAGPRSVRVALEDGTVVRRHFDHVKFRLLPPPHPDQSSTVSTAGPSAQGNWWHCCWCWCPYPDFHSALAAVLCCRQRRKYDAVDNPNAQNMEMTTSRLTCKLESDYTDISFIGCGKAGVVIKATYKADNAVYAIKVCKRKSNEGISNEITALTKQVQHCVRYHDTWTEKPSLPQDWREQKLSPWIDFEEKLRTPVEMDQEYRFIRTEYCDGGNLKDWLQQHSRNVDVCDIFDKLLDAVLSIHNNGLYHGDLVLQNVFVANDENKPQLKIGDFTEAVSKLNGPNCEKVRCHDISRVLIILKQLIYFKQNKTIISSEDTKTLFSNVEDNEAVRKVIELLGGDGIDLNEFKRSQEYITWKKSTEATLSENSCP